MANRNQILGQARFTADGQTFASDGSSTLDLGGVTRESVVGDFDANSYKETPVPSRCELNILIKRGTSLAQINAIDNATLVMVADTGQQYIVRGAYVADAVSLSTSDGKARVVLMGPPAEELL